MRLLFFGLGVRGRAPGLGREVEESAVEGGGAHAGPLSPAEALAKGAEAGVEVVGGGEVLVEVGLNGEKEGLHGAPVRDAATVTGSELDHSVEDGDGILLGLFRGLGLRLRCRWRGGGDRFALSIVAIGL